MMYPHIPYYHREESVYDESLGRKITREQTIELGTGKILATRHWNLDGSEILEDY